MPEMLLVTKLWLGIQADEKIRFNKLVLSSADADVILLYLLKEKADGR